jgi:hypothetical protein
MFESHYPRLDREKLSGRWALSYNDDVYDKFEADSIDFADAMAKAAMKDFGLLQKGNGDTGPSQFCLLTCHQPSLP